jgi:SAM-dependent methyltransferase
MGPSDAEDSIREDENRVRREYLRRSSDARMRRYYARIEPALRRAIAERRRLLLIELDRIGDRSQIRVLDVGCGPGADLEFLASVGFHPSHLAGVDVVGERVDDARRRVPGADIRNVSAATLPYGDGSFDCVIQAVALSSVVDRIARERIASEMLRVARPGGLIVSYDMVVVTDRNPHLVPIDRQELRRLFGASRVIRVRRLTLLLPLASRAPSWVRRAAAKIPYLHTHLLATIRREGD